MRRSSVCLALFICVITDARLLADVTPGIYAGVLSVVTSASPQDVSTTSSQSIRARVTAEGKLYILTAGATSDFDAFGSTRIESAQILTGGTSATFAGVTVPAVVTSNTVKFTFIYTRSTLRFPDDAEPTVLTITNTFNLRKISK